MDIKLLKEAVDLIEWARQAEDRSVAQKAANRVCVMLKDRQVLPGALASALDLSIDEMFEELETLGSREYEVVDSDTLWSLFTKAEA